MRPGGADFLALTPESAPARGHAAWLADQIRAAISTGRLTAGQMLPPSRVLAAELGWSRGVVVQAYGLLTEQALVTTQGRRGTIVTAALPPHPEAVKTREAGPYARLDLSPGVPDLTLFPRAAWLRAERQILATRTSALRYADPVGAPALRRELAGWLRLNRGLQVGPDDVLVVSGVAQGLALIAQVLRRRGHDSVAVEDPGSRGARDTLAHWGLAPTPVAVTAEGVVVSELSRTLACVVMVTPAHQFPTGVVLSASRRTQLVAWAQARGGYVIEDDYDAEQRYDRRPVSAIQPLAPKHVIHTGSVSKSLAPALRLGWVVAPRALQEALVEAKYASDIASPTLSQLVLADLLATGTYDAHIRRLRRHQRQRRDAALRLIAARLPDASVHGIAAGLHILITFPSRRFDDAAIADGLAAEGIHVDPLSRHRIAPGPPGFVLGYAAPAPGAFESALTTLAEMASGRAGRGRARSCLMPRT